MVRPSDRSYLLQLALFLLVFQAWSGLCAHEGHQPLPAKGVQVDTKCGHLTLSRQARDAIGLETNEVSVGEVTSRLFAYAETVAPWNAKAFASAQIPGRITRLLVRPGDRVVKDQVLAELSSRELETLGLEYSQAKKDLALHQQLLGLAQPSALAGAIPMQRMIDLENAFQQSENSLAMARIRARTLGVEASSLDQSDQRNLRHVVRSPISGRVVHSDLSEGKSVEAFEHLFEIVNNDETWVRLQLLEKDLFKVAVGQRVELELADSAVRVVSTIDRIDAGFEANTQVSWAWVTVSHPAIVPGLVGTATIHWNTHQGALAVPLQSVFSDGLQTYVLVEEASTQLSAEYKKRNVKIGTRQLASGDVNKPIVEIAWGDVYPGDHVVVTGGHELSSLLFLSVLQLTEEDRKRLGIETKQAIYQPIATTIQLAASVTLPPENRSVYSSQLPGSIRSHTLSPGRSVRTGDLLVEIASPEFYGLQLDLLRTALDADLSRKRAIRLQEFGGDALSKRVLLETLAKADQLEGRTESLKRQLIALGLRDSEVDSIARDRKVHDYLPIRAAIDGRLTSWSRMLGETVIANQPIVEIQNLDSFWIEAHVPVQSMSAVSMDSVGRASMLSSPEVQFPVAVTRMGPIVNESTRTQRVWLKPIAHQAHAEHAHLANAKNSDTSFDDQRTKTFQDLRDRMQLTVSLQSAKGLPGLVVPSAAVLRDGLHHFVFVQKPDDYVERRRVTLGRSDGEYVEVIHGVLEGEDVVSAGGRELQTAYASLR